MERKSNLLIKKLNTGQDIATILNNYEQKSFGKGDYEYLKLENNRYLSTLRIISQCVLRLVEIIKKNLGCLG